MSTGGTRVNAASNGAGGAGAHGNNTGFAGGDGRVIIIVTY